ncbi:TAP42-like protein [Lipomyces arxii]|uniref:TAP42-like protein n=1 Tax=Lipomyces arxii TaxID=56418 RepID=UPI0034CFE268
MTSERTLRQEFDYALSLYAKLFSSSSLGSPDSKDYSNAKSEHYQSTLTEAVKAFESAKTKSEHLSLFSVNESVEDVATNDLPFLNVDYHLATLTDKIYTASLTERRPLALKSKELYLSFLALCDSYGLLPADQSKFLHEILRAGVETPSFTQVFAKGYSDPGAQRQAKIVKFKREKALEKRIAELKARSSGEDDDRDEDVTREMYLKQVSLFVDRTYDALQGLDSELEILKFAASAPKSPEPAPEPESKEDGYSERVDMPKNNAILTPDGKVNRPFMIVSSREQIRRNVFRPDYELPTMTVEEYLDEEMKRGNIISGGGPQSEEPVEKNEDNEDNDEEADRETMRLRQWDEFTEANPRGSGNTGMNLG